MTINNIKQVLLLTNTITTLAKYDKSSLFKMSLERDAIILRNANGVAVSWSKAESINRELLTYVYKHHGVEVLKLALAENGYELDCMACMDATVLVISQRGEFLLTVEFIPSVIVIEHRNGVTDKSGHSILEIITRLENLRLKHPYLEIDKDTYPDHTVILKRPTAAARCSTTEDLIELCKFIIQEYGEDVLKSCLNYAELTYKVSVGETMPAGESGIVAIALGEVESTLGNTKFLHLTI